MTLNELVDKLVGAKLGHEAVIAVVPQATKECKSVYQAQKN
jgi:hypothetical protein